MVDEASIVEMLSQELERVATESDPASFNSKDMVWAVLKAARKIEPPGVSQQMISRVTGLARGTVMRNMTDLFRSGRVEEADGMLVPRLGGGKMRIPSYVAIDED